MGGYATASQLTCVVFLAMNGVQLRLDIDAAERLVTAVAAGRTEEVKEISRELRALAA